MIRTLYPIDLLPLLLSPGTMPPNQGVAYAFQERLLRLLEDMGFEQIAECPSLMKEVTVKTQPHFMPVRA